MAKLENHPSGWKIIKANFTIGKLINLTCNKITMSHGEIMVLPFSWQKSPYIAPIVKAGTGPDLCPAMRHYIQSRDSLFPLNPELWLKSDGTIPTQSWFINRLHSYFPSDIAGQSMRAGGATALAEAGASPELIRGAGRWSSAAFGRYVRKNPILLHALILGRTAYYDRPPSTLV